MRQANYGECIFNRMDEVDMAEDQDTSDGRKFVFTITPGRTGTAYLAELIRANVADSAVYHEILGYDAWGVDTPDLSHLAQFNAYGSTEQVRAFWARKFSNVVGTGKPLYAETSHLLAKAGLVENIDELLRHGSVYFVVLHREILSTVISLLNRLAFLDWGAKCLWFLDEQYPKNLIEGQPFQKLGQVGLCIWYYYEMITRGYYYMKLFSGKEGVKFIKADLETITQRQNVPTFFSELGIELDADKIAMPEKVNANPHSILSEKDLEATKTLVRKLQIDPEKIAASHVQAGTRF